MISDPKQTLILASSSTIRRTLLEGVGLEVETAPASIDERSLENEMGHIDPTDLAQKLAEAKAQSVSQKHPSAYVIGADQVLVHNDKILHKAADRSQAFAKLVALQGDTHALISAAALVMNGETLWSGTDRARLTMRSLDQSSIDAYLDKAGAAATASVGAYQLETLGANLFERIEGDYFTILGLPLLPLLAALRQHGFDPMALERAL